MKVWSVGFRGKQIAALTLVAVAVTVATSLMNAAALARIGLGQTRARAEVHAYVLYHQARAAIREQGGTDLQTALASDPSVRTYAQAVVGYSPILGYLAIADEDQRIAFHSDPLQEGQLLRPAESIAEFSERPALVQLWLLMRTNPLLVIDLPFGVADDQTFGSVRVAFYTLLLKRQLAGAIATNAAIAAGVVLIVFLTSFYLANRLLAPLEMLRRELGRIDVGEDQPPLDLRNEEDVNRVAEFFTSISRRLNPRSGEGGSTWLETMMGGLADAVFVVNEDRRIVSINKPACRLFGSGRDELQGQSIEQALSETHPLRLLIDEALERGEPLGARAVDLAIEERSVPYTVTAQVIRESGRATGVMVVGRDVESLTRLGSHLSYTQKLAALGQLTSGVAHEIMNPLNAMVLHASLLQDKCSDPEVQRHLEVLNREIRRLEQVVDGFLKFTRPERLQLESVPLDGILEDAVRLVSARAEKGGLLIEKNFTELPPVRGDRELLRQAFYNVLLNACEAMDGSGGRLRILARPSTDGQTLVDIEDTGMGIEPDALPKIFDLYYTTKDAGNGLGLSLTYRIVQLHGGEITVDSNPGQGTRFTISLPEVRE